MAVASSTASSTAWAWLSAALWSCWALSISSCTAWASWASVPLAELPSLAPAGGVPVES